MTMLQAYVLTTLLPNLGHFFSSIFGSAIIFAVITAIAVMIGFISAYDYEDTAKAKAIFLAFYKPLLLVGAVAGILGSVLPSERQIAATLALTYATTQEAQEIYGEAGQFVKEWLKQQTQELQQEVTE